MPTLVLLRHGQSAWNKANLFTGFVDVKITSEGENQAVSAGRLLAENNLLPTVVHTSLLTRAIQTANITLEACERSWIPVRRSWRLNERHYGALQGLNKAETTEKYGEEQVAIWRRGYNTPPPPIEKGSKWDVSDDPRYVGLPPESRPLTESLKEVVDRAIPYLENEIANDLWDRHLVLITAHGNSLRAIAKKLEGLSEDEVVKLEIAIGVPRVYTLEDNLQLKDVHELGDADAIAALRNASANQTKTK